MEMLTEVVTCLDSGDIKKLSSLCGISIEESFQNIGKYNDLRLITIDKIGKDQDTKGEVEEMNHIVSTLSNLAISKQENIDKTI